MRSLLFSLAVVLSLCALSKAGSEVPTAACNVTADCVDNADCVIPGPCDDGTCKCKSTHYVKADKCEAKIANGEACTSVGAAPECVSGMCKGGKCFVMGADGAACTDGTDCTSGYCKATICAAKGNKDDPCTENIACTSGYCDKPNSKCADQAALDAVCTVAEGCTSGVCTGGNCACSTGLKVNAAKTKCVPMVDLDADCDTGSNKADCSKGRLPGTTECEDTKKCVCKFSADADGFCNKQANGGACDTNDDCVTGTCTNKKCDCGTGMTWDTTKKMCEKNKIPKDGDCTDGDVCKESGQTCAKCKGQSKYTCQKDKKKNTTGGATMITVSLTTLFTSILALVL